MNTTIADKAIAREKGGDVERPTADEKDMLCAMLCVARVLTETGSLSPIVEYAAAMYPTLTGSETLPELIAIAEAAGVDATGTEAEIRARLEAL